MPVPIVPKKSLGQNFLISTRVCRRILALANIQAGDVVVEIGPGTGFLTEQLLQQAARVIAVEMDPELVEHLQHHWPNLPAARLRLIQGDILRLRPRDILPQGSVKIVGNLPYNISTAIIRRMKAWRDRFQSATFMLQKEVAERILAQPGSREYGYFSVWTALHFQRIPGFEVAPGCFRPMPKVRSAVVQLIPLSSEPVSPDFDRFLKRAFQYPRKTVRNNLQPEIEHIDRRLAGCGISATARPHQMSPDDFRCLWSWGAGGER